MDVRCEKCSTEYELDESKLRDSGVTVKCTNCGHMFKVRKRAGATGDGRAGSLRTWLVRLGSGEIKACYELSTLQQWIAAAHVDPDCQISRTGKKWKRLGDIAELASFFDIADQTRAKNPSAHPHTVRRGESARLPKPVTGTHGVGGGPRSTMVGVPTTPTRPSGPLSSEEIPTQEVDRPTKEQLARASAKVAADVFTRDTPARPFEAVKAAQAGETEQAFKAVRPLENLASKPPVSGRRVATPESEVGEKTGAWVAAASEKGLPRAETAEGKSGPTGGMARSVPTADAAFVGGKFRAVDDGYDDGLDQPPRGSSAAKWVVAGSVVLLVGAAALIYFGVLSQDGETIAAAEVDAAVVQALDAAVAAAEPADAATQEVDEGNWQSVVGFAGKEVGGDSQAGLELVLEKLDALPDTETILDVVVAKARVTLALAQHAVDAAAIADRKEARAFKATAKTLIKAADGLATRARSLGPQDPRALVVTADVLRLEGKSARNVEGQLRKALSLAPDDRDALLVRALLMERERRLRDARAILSKLIDDAIPDNRARYRLALLDFADESYAEAKSGAEAVVAATPEHAGAAGLLTRIEDAARVSAADPLPPEEPDEPDKPDKPDNGGSSGGSSSDSGGDYKDILLKADRAAEVGNCRSAMGLYRKALDKNPAGVAALTGLGYCHLDGRQFTEAHQKFRAALGVSPNFSSALYGVAEAFQQQGADAQAIAAYKKFLKAHPSGNRAASARRQIERLGGTAPPVGGGDSGGGDDGDDGDDGDGDDGEPGGGGGGTSGTSTGGGGTSGTSTGGGGTSGTSTGGAGTGGGATGGEKPAPPPEKPAPPPVKPAPAPTKPAPAPAKPPATDDDAPASP